MDFDKTSRMNAVGIVAAVFLAIFVVISFIYQIVRGDYYANLSAAGIRVQQVEVPARGEIVDAFGNPFTSSTTLYNVTIDSNFFAPEDLNPLLLTLTETFSDFETEWIDILPISRMEPYCFLEDETTTINALLKKLNLNSSASPEDVMYWLKNLYNLNDYSDADVLQKLKERNKKTNYTNQEVLNWLREYENRQNATDAELIELLRNRYGMYHYTEDEARSLAGIRYSMTINNFSDTNPYTFATDISKELLSFIKERSASLPGVDVEAKASRVYLTKSLACHVIGITGPIGTDNFKKMKENGEAYSSDNLTGYRSTDYVGLSGIEGAYENELRGQNGVRNIYQDLDGNVLKIDEVVKAVPGNTIQLTIQQSLQEATEKALAKQINYLQKNSGATYGKEACAGAAVAISVKTGEILALASNPDYDVSTYYEDYGELATRNPSPLFNRATQGLYTIGSTYKPSVALAALDTHTITPSERVTCTGRYTFYEDYQPYCEGVHGSITVVDALRVSCNIFFYDMGRRMGIETINDYSYRLGLGHKTGIEIPEAAGQLSSPETREAIGEKWYDSYNIQSAIGQLDNQFTMVQLASYIATIANNGVRMQPHLVKTVWDYGMENIIYETEPTVIETIEADDSTWASIKEGMVRSCYNDRYGRGTSSNTWGAERGRTWTELYGKNITVAGKTGSPQLDSVLVNSVFVCFAPADNPEIAIAVIIEKGYEGDRAAPVAKDILTEYFFGENGIYTAKESALTDTQ